VLIEKLEEKLVVAERSLTEQAVETSTSAHAEVSNLQAKSEELAGALAAALDNNHVRDFIVTFPATFPS